MTENDGLVISNGDDDLARLLDRPWPAGISDRVRFDHAHNRWHVWNGKQWRPDEIGSVYELVRGRLSDWLAKTVDTAKAKALLPLLNQQKKESVLKTLATFPGIAMRGDEWDTNPFMLGCENGLLDLRTLTFDPEPDPALLVSRSTGTAWDADAECPHFIDFISQITGNDPGLAQYLLHVLGYSLFGWQREQKFWLWVGDGNNGKGTLSKVVSFVLGEYADSPSSELYMKPRMGPSRSDAARADLVKLQGKRFTWMSEPSGNQFNDELVKAHTGDDPIQARALYSNNFLTFRPTHTIIFLTNKAPKTEDVGVSMRRRVRVIRFNQDFSDPKVIDFGLEDKLKAEASGIQTLLAAYANDWLTNGLQEPEVVTEWSNEYIEDNDPLTAFVASELVVERGASLAARAAYDAYTDWCERTDTEKLTGTGFGLALSRKFNKVRTPSGYKYQNVREMSAMEQAHARFD